MLRAGLLKLVDRWRAFVYIVMERKADRIGILCVR